MLYNQLETTNLKNLRCNNTKENVGSYKLFWMLGFSAESGIIFFLFPHRLLPLVGSHLVQLVNHNVGSNSLLSVSGKEDQFSKIWVGAYCLRSGNYESVPLSILLQLKQVDFYFELIVG